MRAAAIITSAWLTLSLFLFSVGYSPASADVPYYGILRGFENGGVNSIAGFDIAADESGIYIVGEFFEAPGYGPMVLFLNPDHSFRCQRVLEFKVDNSGISRVPAAGYSVALNETHVIVAGTYSESPTKVELARLFIAVFDKDDCQLTGIRELHDKGIEWYNIYPILGGGGIKVLWDSGRSSIYLMLQTLQPLQPDGFEDFLYLLQLDSGLNILNLAIYNEPGPKPFLISDMAQDANFLYLVGVYEDKDEILRLIYMSATKDDLTLSNARVIIPTFPDYRVSDTRIAPYLPYILLTGVTGENTVVIAFSIVCSGLDCSEDGSTAIRLGIVSFPLWVRAPLVSAMLYRWVATHWNVPGPSVYGQNNTWLTGFVEAGDMFYMVGFIGSSPDSGEDGFVYAVDARTLNAQYMLRLVSLDGDASTGGPRVGSFVLGVGSHGNYAYITGTAGNYYLEFNPFNPSNVTGAADLIPISLPILRSHVLEELRNLNSIQDKTPSFDRDVSQADAGFYGVLRLRPSGMTVTSTTTSTTTSTETVTSTTTETSTVTSTTTSTVTTTPTTTVTRFTTATQTAVSTRVETEYVFSTVYTTRVVDGTVTRFETVTSVTTVPVFTTFTDTTLLRVTATATTTPTVYATVQTTVNRTLTVRQTTTEAVVAEGYVPWPFLLLPFIPLLLLPPIVVASGRRLTVTILEGAAEQPETQPASILGEYFKPSVGKLRRNGKVTFHNKDRATHELELYSPELPDKQKVFTLKPGEKTRIKIKEPGKYFFRLTAKPEKIGVLEVD